MSILARSLAFALALALAAIAALPAAAEDGEALRRLELSARLYAEGAAQSDPVLLLAAARLRRDLELTRADGSAAGGFIPPGWEEMLDAAREAAAGDAALLALIDDTAAEGGRGVTTGQVYSISEIGQGAQDIYPALPFQAGEYAEVYVESADGADLNVYVYDAAGKLVCADTDASAISYCGWRPAEAGEFTIKVENAGEAAAGYALMTN